MGKMHRLTLTRLKVRVHSGQGEASLDAGPFRADRIPMTRTGRHRVRRRLVPPAMLAGVTILLLMTGSNSLRTPPMDDTYIHLVYGNSILSDHPLCYSGSSPSSGFTSPVWLLPSSLASVFGVGYGPTMLMLLSLLSACLAMLIMEPDSALLLVFAGPFLFHSSSGMETALACAAVAAAWKWMRDGGGIKSGSLILAWAFLTRPDLAVLFIPMVISMRDRRFFRIALLAAPSAAIGMIWVLWNLRAAGLPLPSTFYAKQSISWFRSAQEGLPGLLKGLLLTSPLLLFAAAVSVKGMLRRGKKSDEERGRAGMAAAVILLFASAFALQPNSYFQMRYYVPALVSAALAAGVWLRGLGRRRRLNTVILVLSMIPGLVVFGGRRVGASTDVHHIDVLPSEYLLTVAERDQTVAAADIGAVRWITGMEILDLDGLVTPERLPGRDRAGWPFIRDRSDYLLAFPGQYSRLVEDAGDDLVFLAGFGSPSSVICGEDSVSLWAVD